MAGEVIRKVLEHRGSLFSQAGDLSLYFVKETILRTFEEPAATDLILAISVEGDDQAPEMLESEARQNTDRMSKSLIAGRCDHGEKTLMMEIRPPLALGGTSTIMGDAVLEAIFGFRRIVNSQATLLIDSITTFNRTETVVRCTASETAIQLGDIVALRSVSALSTDIDNDTAVVGNITFDAGGAGVHDYHLKPSFRGEPVAADTIQGGVTWKPQKDWAQTWSALWVQGFSADAAEGGVGAMATFNLDARGLLTFETPFHYRKTIYSGIGFISGTGGGDDLETTDTVI
ncbi:hypothetical protein LCGC14_2001900, partial [marine sediment metagenome]